MEPPEKRRTSLSECIVFCETSLSKTQADNPAVQNPRVEGLKAILKAAELRKDDRLFPVKDDILNESTVIKVHQKCRTNYTNKRNIQPKKNTATCADGVTDMCQEIEIRLASSLLSTMKKFKYTGREQSATFRYWISFLDAGDTLLKLLRADREADFKMHLTAVLEVIPYFFLAGRSIQA